EVIEKSDCAFRGGRDAATGVGDLPETGSGEDLRHARLSGRERDVACRGGGGAWQLSEGAGSDPCERPRGHGFGEADAARPRPVRERVPRERGDAGETREGDRQPCRV